MTPEVDSGVSFVQYFGVEEKPMAKKKKTEMPASLRKALTAYVESEFQKSGGVTQKELDGAVKRSIEDALVNLDEIVESAWKKSHSKLRETVEKQCLAWLDSKSGQEFMINWFQESESVVDVIENTVNRSMTDAIAPMVTKACQEWLETKAGKEHVIDRMFG